MSWPPATTNVDPNASGSSDLGPSVVVPPNTTMVLKGAGNGAINDTIKVIRFSNSGPGTAVNLTDGDGSSYADPKGSGNLIANPYNNRVIQAASAPLTNPPDYQMYNQPSYSGAWTIKTGADTTCIVYGDFS